MAILTQKTICIALSSKNDSLLYAISTRTRAGARVEMMLEPHNLFILNNSKIMKYEQFVAAVRCSLAKMLYWDANTMTGFLLHELVHVA